MAKSSLYNKITEIKNIRDKIITTSNLRSGINAFGVHGNFTNGANILSTDISNGKLGYANGTTVVGSLREYTPNTMNIPLNYTVDNSNNLFVGTYREDNYITENDSSRRLGAGIVRNLASSTITFNQISSMLNIQPVDIKKDKQILDIKGQYDASTEFQGIKMDPVVASNQTSSLTSSIREISGLDISNAINLYAYFSNLRGLVSVSNLNAPNVTNLGYLFYMSNNITSVSSLNFYGDAQTNTNCWRMFDGCQYIKTIDNSIKFPKVINNCSYIFNGCYNLISINTDLDFSNIVSLDYPFAGCYNLTNISNLTFNTQRSVNCQSLFSNLCNLDVMNINFANVNVSISNYMFMGIKNITDENLPLLLNQFNRFCVNSGTFSNTSITKIPQFNTYNKVSLNQSSAAIFSGCNKITTLQDTQEFKPLMQFNYLFNMFSYCSNLSKVNVELNSRVTSISSLFASCKNLQDVTLNAYNATSSINYFTLSTAFQYCNNLNSCNIIMNRSNLMLYANNAFTNCSNLKTVNLPGSSINSASRMFENCTALQNIIIPSTFIGNYYTISYYGMFANCVSLQNIGCNTLNIYSNSVANLFLNCISLNQDLTCYIENNNFPSGLNNVFNHTGITNLNLYVKFGTYGSNTFYIDNLCPDSPNMQSLNINVIDIPNNISNGLYMVNTINKCTNLKTYNLYLKAPRRYVYISESLYNCNMIQNIYMNIDTTNNINLQFRHGNASVINVDIYNSSNFSSYNIYNMSGLPQINCPTVKNIDSYYIMYSNNVNNINMFESVNTLGDVFIGYLNNSLPNLNINFSNASIINNLRFSDISKISSINIISNNLYFNNNYSYSNFGFYTIYNTNTFKLNADSLKGVLNTFNMYQINVPEKIEFNLNNLTTINYIYLTYMYSNNIVYLNIGNTTDIKYLNVYSASNGLNKGINIYAPSLKNISNASFFFCNNYTNDSLDNIMGLMANVNYSGRKNISSLFLYSNVLDRCKNLPNYTNLKAKGWGN